MLKSSNQNTEIKSTSTPQTGSVNRTSETPSELDQLNSRLLTIEQKTTQLENQLNILSGRNDNMRWWIGALITVMAIELTVLFIDSYSTKDYTEKIQESRIEYLNRSYELERKYYDNKNDLKEQLDSIHSEINNIFIKNPYLKK